MNRWKSPKSYILRGALVGALLLFSVLGFCACKSATPPAVSHITSVTVNKEGTLLQVKAELSAKDLQAYQGKQLFLYALMPDTPVADLAGKTPVAQCKAERSPTFKAELSETDVCALYSAYVLAGEDGVVLNETPQYIGNLSELATKRGQQLWEHAQKGIYFDDASSAASLGCMLGMTEVRLSSLLAVSDFSESDVESALRADALAALDRAVGDAAGNQMQFSLHLNFDRRIGFAQCTALLDFLVSRYNSSSLYDLGSVYISTGASYTATETASLAHIARMALTRHRGAGELYIVCSADTLTAQKVFFSEVLARVDELGGFTWGAAVVPTLPQELTLWEADEQLRAEAEQGAAKSELSDLMLPVRLSTLSTQLKSYDGTQPSSFVLCNLRFPYADEKLRAASYAYAYRQAIAAGADAVYYGAHLSDSEGVLTADGAHNNMTTLFSEMDRGLSAEQNYLCSSVIGEAWQSLAATEAVRREVGGSGSLQKPYGTLSVLADFSDNTLGDFSVFRGVEVPTVRNSAVWSSSVLTAWMEQPTAYGGAGVGRQFDNTADMKSTLSLTARVLLQGTAESTPTVRLRLWGTDRTGKLLTYSAEQAVSADTWQTVTFSVSAFFSELSDTHPYTLTLEVVGGDAAVAGQAEDDAFVFWMKDLLYSRPESSGNGFLPALLLAGGVAGVFVVTVCLYHFGTSRRRRRR